MSVGVFIRRASPSKLASRADLYRGTSYVFYSGLLPTYLASYLCTFKTIKEGDFDGRRRRRLKEVLKREGMLTCFDPMNGLDGRLVSSYTGGRWIRIGHDNLILLQSVSLRANWVVARAWGPTLCAYRARLLRILLLQ